MLVSLLRGSKGDLWGKSVVARCTSQLSSAKMELHGDGSSSLRPEPNKFSGSLCRVLSPGNLCPLAARGLWSWLWFGDGAKDFGYKRDRWGDIEWRPGAQVNLEKSFKISVQKSVNWKIGLLVAQIKQPLCSSCLREEFGYFLFGSLWILISPLFPLVGVLLALRGLDDRLVF